MERAKILEVESSRILRLPTPIMHRPGRPSSLSISDYGDEEKDEDYNDDADDDGDDENENDDALCFPTSITIGTADILDQGPAGVGALAEIILSDLNDTIFTSMILSDFND